MRAIAIAATLMCLAAPACAANGRVLEVGPARAFDVPSAAAAIARDGDTIRIDAGTYRDCAVWRASDLTIEGIGGRPLMRDVTCASQAIWLIFGSRITVRNVAIAGARAPYGNGAGIKFTGATLSVSDADFLDNQNGILTRGGPDSVIRVTRSTFVGNGACAPICAHGIYAGADGRLVVTNSIFHDQRVGHHIKSRALLTEISGNRIEDGMDGTASYAIDLPNAGTAFVMRNRIEKGPKSENSSTAIAIGAEGATNPGNGIYIAGNAFRNDNPMLGSFVRSFAPEIRVELLDNRFSGIATLPFRVAPREPKG